LIRNNQHLVKKEHQKDIRIQFNNDKQVEYYSGQVIAWFNTKLERDKSILTLSTGAIGLLITLASAIDIKSNGTGCLILIVLYIAIFCYLSSIILVLRIFLYNAKYIQADITNNKEQFKEYTRKLKNLDSFSIWAFIIGIIFSIIFSGILIYNKNFVKDKIVMNEKELKILDSNNCQISNESYDEMPQLKPMIDTNSSMYMKKSYDEMPQIKPTQDNNSSKDNNSSSK
jgi:hypothetical protein